MVLSTFPFFLIFSMSALHQTRVLSLFIFVNPFTFPVAYANSTCSAHLHSTAQQRRFQTELSCPEAGLIIENDKKWLNWKSETSCISNEIYCACQLPVSVGCVFTLLLERKGVSNCPVCWVSWPASMLSHLLLLLLCQCIHVSEPVWLNLNITDCVVFFWVLIL